MTSERGIALTDRAHYSAISTPADRKIDGTFISITQTKCNFVAKIVDIGTDPDNFTVHINNLFVKDQRS